MYLARHGRPAEPADLARRDVQSCRQELARKRPSRYRAYCRSMLAADRIASRAIHPGNRISEQKICDEFQMSRSTAREVLTALAHPGLVVRPPNRSATVTRFTAEEVYETFNIRVVLEGLCFRLAVENEAPESWQDLVDLYGAPMQDIIGRGDHRAQLKTIDYLIQRVRAASGNRTLCTMLESIDARSR